MNPKNLAHILLISIAFWVTSLIPAFAQYDAAQPPIQSDSVFLSQDAIEIPLQANTFAWRSAEFTPSFSSNAFGLKWKGEGITETNVTLIAHIINHAQKQRSITMSQMGDDVKGPLGEGAYATKPVVVNDIASIAFEILLTQDADGRRPRLEQIELVYFQTGDSSPMPSIAVSPQGMKPQALSASERLTIITRETWGADESWRMNAQNEPLWPEEYEKPRVFVVHHTAASDGGTDPTATVRAIYYWHAVVLGWGDVGYNYLIDPAGNIYHGRNGADGVVGGHTYNSTTDIGYNRGSIGIALLGCYEESTGACTTQHQTTPEMNAALARLIAVKSVKLNFQPRSQVEFMGERVKRVLGHRDLDYTYCPGSSVYAQLGDIRLAASERFTALRLPDWQGELESVSETTLATHQSHELLFTYRNTGSRSWTQDRTYIKLYNNTGRKPTLLRHANWQDSLARVHMEETEIAPGGVATFRVSIQAPSVNMQDMIVTKLFARVQRMKKSKATIAFEFTNRLANNPLANAQPSQNTNPTIGDGHQSVPDPIGLYPASTSSPSK